VPIAPHWGVDLRRLDADHQSVAEYALVTAMVATLALALASIPDAELSRRLPVTTARATALVTESARSSHVPVSGARAAYARAPYGRPPLRYLYAAGWITGKQLPAKCIFAKVTPDYTRQELTTAIRKDSRLASRLRRMNVTVGRAVDAAAKGIASAC
jgi:hypothetical protein